jgi:hypothetical protein
VIVDSLPGPSTTALLLLMACDTVVVQFDGTRASTASLRLFLALLPSWLDHYKPHLIGHRPRVVVLATPESIDCAGELVERRKQDPAQPHLSVVCSSPVESLLTRLASA